MTHFSFTTPSPLRFTFATQFFAKNKSQTYTGVYAFHIPIIIFKYDLKQYRLTCYRDTTFLTRTQTVIFFALLSFWKSIRAVNMILLYSIAVCAVSTVAGIVQCTVHIQYVNVYTVWYCNNNIATVVNRYRTTIILI